jgi:hypothetical protein
MRTTLNLEEDSYIAASQMANRLGISLGAVVSKLIRDALSPPTLGMPKQLLRGRFALLPARDELVTTAHVRELMEREGI